MGQVVSSLRTGNQTVKTAESLWYNHVIGQTTVLQFCTKIDRGVYHSTKMTLSLVWGKCWNILMNCGGGTV